MLERHPACFGRSTAWHRNLDSHQDLVCFKGRLTTLPIPVCVRAPGRISTGDPPVMSGPLWSAKLQGQKTRNAEGLHSIPRLRDASFSKGAGLACPVDVPKMAAGRGFAPRLILIGSTYAKWLRWKVVAFATGVQSQGDYCC